jgi:hypothetical protein
VSRFLASVLVALFSWSLISPAVLADAASNLPACCRRAGLHHCAVPAPGATRAGIDAAPCLQFPGMQAAPAAAKLPGLTKSPQPFYAPLVDDPITHAQPESRYRISYSRAGQKRGPPLSLSSFIPTT